MVKLLRLKARHLTAGSYGSEAEAESVRKTYVDAGMDAFNVVVPSGGASAYEVWVGEAPTQPIWLCSNRKLLYYPAPSLNRMRQLRV